jgi:hypothetical protein
MKKFIRSCHPCQIYAPAPYLKSPVDGRNRNVFELFKQFATDYVGPLPVASSGANKYILVGMEMFSRWPMAVPCKRADAMTAATFLYEEIFTKFGPLTTILTDNGKHFANQVLEEYIKIVKAKHKFSTSYHPETSGMVEKYNNGTLVNGIRKLASMNPKDWDTHINTLLYTYRIRAHEAIGISPYELLYGTQPNSHDNDPLYLVGKKMGFERLMSMTDMRNEVIMEEKRKVSINKSKEIIWFLSGAVVIKKNEARDDKLSANWLNKTFTVIAAYGNNTYQLVDNENGRPLKRKINGTKLKRYFKFQAFR